LTLRARCALLRRLGARVDVPSLYPHLSGCENLEIRRRVLRPPQRSITAALETVHLTQPAGRLVKTYSLGMRQRPGIALALLGDPELLVLDEPANGLDPAGIQEVRHLLRDLPRSRGVTVFLSSHLLTEVEQVATHVAILAQGALRYEGAPEGLPERGKPVLEVEVDQPARARELLERAGFEVRVEASRLVLDSRADRDPARLARRRVSGTDPRRRTLLMLGRVLGTETLKIKRTLATVIGSACAGIPSLWRSPRGWWPWWQVSF
jgi:ABC-2 type transport system ATP-binding protein